MKTLYTFLITILLLVSIQIQPQEIEATLSGNTSSEGFSVKKNSGTTVFRVRGDGNVGIGTTSPDAILHTHAIHPEQAPRLERSWAPGTGGGELLNLVFTPSSGNAVATDAGAITFIGEDAAGNEESYAKVIAIIEDPTNGSEDGALSFHTLGGGSSTEKVRISSAGNVGIGTTTPIQGLDIYQKWIRVSNDFGILFNEGGSPYLDFIYGNGSSHYIGFKTSNSDRMRIDDAGNIGIGTTSFGTNAAGVIGIGNGTAPTTSPGDMVQLYAEDVSSSSELKVKDESGTVTTLSPHNFSMLEKSEPMAWSFYSENHLAGKKINVDMLKVVRLVESISGERLVYINNIDSQKYEKILETNLNEVDISLVEKVGLLKKENEDLKSKLIELERKINSLVMN